MDSPDSRVPPPTPLVVSGKVPLLSFSPPGPWSSTDEGPIHFVLFAVTCAFDLAPGDLISCSIVIDSINFHSPVTIIQHLYSVFFWGIYTRPIRFCDVSNFSLSRLVSVTRHFLQRVKVMNPDSRETLSLVHTGRSPYFSVFDFPLPPTPPPPPPTLPLSPYPPLSNPLSLRIPASLYPYLLFALHDTPSFSPPALSFTPPPLPLFYRPSHLSPTPCHPYYSSRLITSSSPLFSFVPIKPHSTLLLLLEVPSPQIRCFSPLYAVFPYLIQSVKSSP